MTDSIKAILGTITFGSQVNQETSEKMISYFLEQGHSEIDTAYVYNHGQSEKYIGTAFSALGVNNKVTISTKANPRVTSVFDYESIQVQINKSLERLQQESVDIFYLHFPDPRTPLKKTLEACAELHALGKFQELGLSNFPSWQVVKIWHLCQLHGWPKPTVYQGLYNGFSRGVEPELLPALRQCGMRFYAYNPLAGGILAGKYNNITDEPAPGRFTFRPNYRDRYWNKAFFEALELLSAACNKENITMVDAAYGWLIHHSELSAAEGDGVVIGASNLDQLKQNLKVIQQPPLSEAIIDDFNAAGIAAKPEWPVYFRTSV